MIENEQVYVSYVADGVQREWEFPHSFVNPADVALYIKHEGEMTKIESSQYVFNEETNKVTYPKDETANAVPSGDYVLVCRETPISQEEDSLNTNFKSNDIERIADKLTMIEQELADKLSRAIAYDPVQYHEVGTNAKDYIDLMAQYRDSAAANSADAANSKTQAAASASAAATSAQNAATSESNAASSATAASNSAAAAAASEQHTIQNEQLLQEYVDQAEESANTAVSNATQAASSATSAAASATAASASETSAAASAASASASAETATTKAAEADASAQSAAASAAVFTVDSVLSPTSRNPLENRAIYNELNTLKLVQIVEELPATGDGKSVYGVIQDEMTRDGYPIVQLFCWDVEDELWYAIAAYSIDIDPNGIVYEDSVPYATSTRVGGFKETFIAATGTWTVTTEEL